VPKGKKYKAIRYELMRFYLKSPAKTDI